MAKWRKRATVDDLKTGPKESRFKVLTEAEEAAIVAFRRHTAYVARRLAEGHSKLEAIRALKRYIVREVYGIIMRRHKGSTASTSPLDKQKGVQGSQFTSTEFTEVLLNAQVKISMDGRGRWIDNRMIERLWRSLKYECVYLQAYASMSDARAGIGRYLGFYNSRRPHSSLDGKTPDQAYFNQHMPKTAVA